MKVSTEGSIASGVGRELIKSCENDKVELGDCVDIADDRLEYMGL